MAEAKTKAPAQPTALELALERIDKLEQALSKIAVHTGNGNLLSEFGLKRWTPERKDMNKNRG